MLTITISIHGTQNSGSRRSDDNRQNASRREHDANEPELSHQENKSNVKRRSILQVLGISAIPFVAGTASAAESNDGYGTGGYGISSYGGETNSNNGTDDGTSEEDSLTNIILLDGIGTVGGSQYEFTVTGSVKKSTDSGASINDGDIIDGNQVTGSLGGWRDAFRFSGELENLTVDGPARVYVNGNQIAPENYGGEQSHLLTIVGNGVRSEYEFTTDGSIEMTEGDGATVVSEGRAEGLLNGAFTDFD